MRSSRRAPATRERLADRLIPFHRVAPPCEGPADQVAAAASTIVTENWTNSNPSPAGRSARCSSGLVAAATRCFVAEHGDLVERASAGWIREGHGDLRVEHVCVEAGRHDPDLRLRRVQPGLRCADVASDLAFLLMDLERLGAGSQPPGFVARYRRRASIYPTPCSASTGHTERWSGPRSPASASLPARRRRGTLFVRSRRLPRPGHGGGRHVRAGAHRHDWLERHRQSTVAGALASGTGRQAFASDAVRKELARQPRTRPPNCWG